MADWYFRDSHNKNIKACPGCGNLVRSDQEFCPYCTRSLAPERGARGKLRQLAAMPEIATKALIGILVFFFLLQMLTDVLIPAAFRSDGGGGLFSLLTADRLAYVLLGANIPALVMDGQVWRFFTSCLLHYGIIHILFNCWAFWDLGRLAEKFWGAKQVFATFVLTGVCGSAASFVWHGLVLRQNVSSAGASGAICGVLGLLLGTYYRNRYHLGEMLGSGLIRWAVYIIVFGLVAGADNAAHIGGMLSGAALGYFLVPTSRSKRPASDARIWSSLAVLALLVAVVCLAFMGVFYGKGMLELRAG